MNTKLSIVNFSGALAAILLTYATAGVSNLPLSFAQLFFRARRFSRNEPASFTLN
jgi:hypothetical protein